MTSAREDFVAGYRKWAFDKNTYWHLGDRKFYLYEGRGWIVSRLLTESGIPELGPFPGPNYLDSDYELGQKYDRIAERGEDVRTKYPGHIRILYSCTANAFLSAVRIGDIPDLPDARDECERQWEEEIDDCAQAYADGRMSADEYDECKKRAAAKRDLCKRQGSD